MDKLNMPLEQYLKTHKHLSSRKLHKLFVVINIMHENGVYHNDLHGGNIMMDDRGRFYIIDFGNAKIIGDNAEYYEHDDYNTLLSMVEWDDANKRDVQNYIDKRFPNSNDS